VELGYSSTLIFVVQRWIRIRHLISWELFFMSTATPSIASSSTVVAPDHIVLMNYRLVDDAGKELDASQENEPLAYLHGRNSIIPGLENALTGLKAGDKKEVTVTPANGYGERQNDLQFTLPRSQFGDQTPQIGMMIELQAQEDNLVAHVVALDENSVTLDGNHPMAGKTLHFSIEIVSVRPATQEEIEHGHAHGPDGHHHL
jgi:FKBP-type peptidyl-prolyl cis-trans isomerase SlyD